jgi:hypothetical protein
MDDNHIVGKYVAQMADPIQTEIIAVIVRFLVQIIVIAGLTCGIGMGFFWGCLKLIKLYKDCCWDKISATIILVNIIVFVYFGDWINTLVSVNLFLILLLVQLGYIIARWYIKCCRNARGYF